LDRPRFLIVALDRRYARTTIGEERESVWSRQKQGFSGFEGFESMTDRQIPVVILEPT